jgi:3-oxo-4-pregnene-20-carboxyl-CoA dehydrogenase beta subunit
VRCDLDTQQADLVAEVDAIIDAAGCEADPRECFARLGEARLLAVHYPETYGGRGLSLACHAAVSERIGMRGLPDVPHLITVQAVGCAILTFGTDPQREHWLAPIASGRLLASLLLSEADAGSDLTRITTVAVADGDGWRLSGHKAWSMWTEWSGIALCCARTREGSHRYDGISLFIVDLSDPGVAIERVDRAGPEPYHTVIFEGVRLQAGALVGRLHGGWAQLPTIIGFERGGFDYLTRAQTWLAAAEATLHGLRADRQADLAPGFAQRAFHVENARALSYHAAATADGLEMDEMTVSYAKLASGQAAQSVARWAGEELLPLSPQEDGDAMRTLLARAVTEAPELTISGGARELQLDLISGDPAMGWTI